MAAKPKSVSLEKILFPNQKGVIPLINHPDGTTTPVMQSSKPVMYVFPANYEGAPTENSEFKRQVDEAIQIIENSQYAKAGNGADILAKLQEAQAAGKIKKSMEMGDKLGVARIEDSVIGLPDDISDPNLVASVLVHEGAHIVDFDTHVEEYEHTLWDEIAAHEEQLEFYKEQKENGFSNQKLDDILTAQKNGMLEENVRSRYPVLNFNDQFGGH